MKTILCLVLLLMGFKTAVFPEIMGKMTIDTNSSGASIIFYDGDKEIARKIINNKSPIETKGNIPDGMIKIYRDDKLFLVCPFKNGKMNGEAVLYQDGKEEKMVFKDDEEVRKDWNLKRQGSSVKYYYDNGKLHASYILYPDGKEKTSEYYNEKGKMTSLNNFNTNGSFGGIQKYFTEDGRLTQINNYNSFGNMDGIQKYYNESGMLTLEAVFQNGTGNIKAFDENGKITESYRAVSNDIYMHDGPAKKYEKGKLVEENNYVTNAMDSTNKQYLESGWTIVTIYRNGVCRQENEYDEDGKLLDVKEYNHNDSYIEGYTKRYRDGALVQETITSNNVNLSEFNYLNGNLISKIKYTDYWNNDFSATQYFDNGSVFKSYSIKKNKLDAGYKEYYENSQLKEECVYSNGVKVGFDRTYSETGRIMSIDTYKIGYKINSKKYDEQEKLVLNQDYPYKPDLNMDNSAPDVSDTLRTAFYNTGKFTVIERTRIKAVIDEQAFQLTGLTAEKDMAKMGNILNVKFIVLGSMSKIGSEYIINIRVVSVENSEIVAAETGKSESEKQLVSTIENLASHVADKLLKIKPDSYKKTMAVLDLDNK